MVLCQDDSCIECDKKYTDVNHKWCKPCLINYLEQNFMNWTSGNEKIDQLIQKLQLKIDSYNDIVFEWVPYSQFNNIKVIYDNHAKVYSAIWKDSPFYYDNNIIRWSKKRRTNIKVVLRHLVNNSQDIDNELLNEV
jgi:hypothetical protein